MTKVKVDHVEEFKKRYQESQKVASIAAQLEERKMGWSAARDALVSMKILDAKIANDMDDRAVDSVLMGAMDSAKTNVESYFGNYKAQILGGVANKDLEAIALGIRPVEVPQDNGFANVHNPLVKLVSGYQGVAEMNQKIKDEEIAPEDYRAFVLENAKDIVGKIASSKDETDKAKKLYALAILQTAARSTAAARATGNVLLKDKMDKIKEYLGKEEVAKDYNLASFTRNNLMYSPAEQSIEIAGKLLTQKKKK